MTSVTAAQGGQAAEGALQRFLRATEIDTRMLGMIGALVLIWIGMDLFGVWKDVGFTLNPVIIYQNDTFLTARNLWTLLVQTTVIGVMATGMVMIIVMRNIDLSAGSMLSFVGVVTGYAQAYWLGPMLGTNHPMIWIIAVVIALGMGALLGALNGFLVAYAGIPAFIVTLGGMLVYSGSAWWVIRGETVGLEDSRFAVIGGNPPESWLGASASWALGLLACAAIIWGLIANRGQRARFNFPQRPMWAEFFLGIVGCAVTIGTVLVVNAYEWPPKVAENYANDHNIPIPPGGLGYVHGFAVPVLIALAVAITMTFIATRTRFGRYVYAIGGNPEAAELAGVNTRKITMMMFSLMGVLTAIAACIATSRLEAATNSIGQFSELYVIAAAVIGGTALAGGVGTIYGALLGALVLQSLQSGMTLLNIDSAVKDLVVGTVLVFAVWIDQTYRRRKA